MEEVARQGCYEFTVLQKRILLETGAHQIQTLLTA